MNHAYFRFITCTLMLACLGASGTAAAGIKLQFIERPTPQKLYQPPGFHTNQGGRSVSGDAFIKPRGEVTFVALQELLTPQGKSTLPLLPAYGTPATVLTTRDMIPGSKRSFILKPFNTFEGFNPEKRSTISVQPPLRNAPPVPAPGALAILLAGTLGLGRRRRRRP